MNNYDNRVTLFYKNRLIWFSVFPMSHLDVEPRLKERYRYNSTPLFVLSWYVIG